MCIKIKENLLNFWKKKLFFMSQSYFYIRVSSEKNIHLIVTMKMNWYLFVSKLIILHIKTVVPFVPNSTFLQTLLWKLISRIFFSFWTFISYQTLLQDNVRLFANLTNKTPKKERMQCIFLLNPSFKTGNNVKKHKNFFSLWKPYQKKYNEVFSSLLYYKLK